MSTEHLDLILEITRTIEAVESCGGERKALDLLTDSYKELYRRMPAQTVSQFDSFLNSTISAIDPERDKVAMAEEMAAMVKRNWVGPVEATTALFGKINKILKGEKE